VQADGKGRLEPINMEGSAREEDRFRTATHCLEPVFEAGEVRKAVHSFWYRIKVHRRILKAED